MVNRNLLFARCSPLVSLMRNRSLQLCRVSNRDRLHLVTTVMLNAPSIIPLMRTSLFLRPLQEMSGQRARVVGVSTGVYPAPLLCVGFLWGYPDCVGLWLRRGAEFEIESAGQHEILVYDDDFSNSGTYMIQLERIVPVSVTPLSFDVQALDQTDQESDTDFFSFKGTVGREVDLNVTSTGVYPAAQLCAEIRLPSSPDVIIASQCITGEPYSFSLPAALTEVGDYVVLVYDREYLRKGTYVIEVHCREECPTSGGCTASAEASTYETSPVYGASDLGKHLAYLLLSVGLVIGLGIWRRKK